MFSTCIDVVSLYTFVFMLCSLVVIVKSIHTAQAQQHTPICTLRLRTYCTFGAQSSFSHNGMHTEILMNTAARTKVKARAKSATPRSGRSHNSPDPGRAARLHANPAPSRSSCQSRGHGRHRRSGGTNAVKVIYSFLLVFDLLPRVPGNRLRDLCRIRVHPTSGQFI